MFSTTLIIIFVYTDTIITEKNHILDHVRNTVCDGLVLKGGNFVCTLSASM